MSVKPGRKRKYHTVEELREARNAAQRRYNQRKREANAHAMNFMGEESHGLPYPGVDPIDDQRRSPINRLRLPGGYGTWRLSEEETRKHKEKILAEKRAYARSYYYKLKHAANGTEAALMEATDRLYETVMFIHTQVDAEPGKTLFGFNFRNLMPGVGKPIAVKLREVMDALGEISAALSIVVPEDVLAAVKEIQARKKQEERDRDE